MKRLICVLLLLLLLCGCGKTKKEMQQPVNFYYAYSDARTGAYSAEDGALAAEVRDLGPQTLSAEEILRRYLAGPVSAELVSPFPEGITLHSVSQENGLLTISLGERFQKLTGIDRTMAAACLVKTMTQFSDIHALLLECAGHPIWEHPLTMEDFLLLDDTATSDAVSMKLYYGAADGRYLAEENRTRSFQSEEEIPLYILQQLLDGPTEDGSTLLIPDGTSILGVQTDNGVCTVDFSETFLWYQPNTHLEARRMILSVANALTELPEIACVRFLCGGDPINYYMGLDLSEPIYRDEAAFGVEHLRAEHTDVTLYVPCGNHERLGRVPVVLERTGGRSLAGDTLNALLSVESINSYSNPFPEGTMALSVDTKDGLCKVTLNAAFALCDVDERQAKRAVHSLVATLCALDEVDQVSIEIHNGKLTRIDLSEPLQTDPAWLLP